MLVISVAGGVYVETCLDPEWQMIFGSGGRAAAGLAALVESVQLHTYASKSMTPEVAALAETSGFELNLYPSSQTISFDYLHCLSNPVVSPHPTQIHEHPAMEVEADVVLRFGFMEGDARVKGEWVVYDPQSPLDPRPFSKNGSSANHLAIVANETEIRQMGQTPHWESAAHGLIATERAEVVVVKRGSLGAWVFTPEQIQVIPPYVMDLTFTIGSGDIFSAAFTYFWTQQRLHPFEAADLASRATALYCHSRSHRLVEAPYLRQTVARVAAPLPEAHRVYLAGPFFNLAQRWLVEEARSQLFAQGLKVFSPLHDVGMVGNPAEIAERDLAALDACDRVLALLDGTDPGTVFEVGYARSKGIPVVAFVQQLEGEPLTMIEGTDCEIVRDFTTAIYRTAWIGRVR